MKDRTGERVRVERGRPESHKAVREVSEVMVTEEAETPANETKGLKDAGRLLKPVPPSVKESEDFAKLTT